MSLAQKFASMSRKAPQPARRAPFPAQNLDELNALKAATTRVCHDVPILSLSDVQRLGTDNKHLKGRRNYRPSNVFQGKIREPRPKKSPKPKTAAPKSAAPKKRGPKRSPPKPKRQQPAERTAEEKEQHTIDIMNSLIMMGVGSKSPSPIREHSLFGTPPASPIREHSLFGTPPPLMDGEDVIMVDSPPSQPDTIMSGMGSQDEDVIMTDAPRSRSVFTPPTEVCQTDREGDTPMRDIKDFVCVHPDTAIPSIEPDYTTMVPVVPHFDNGYDSDSSVMSVEDDSDYELELQLKHHFNKLARQKAREQAHQQ